MCLTLTMSKASKKSSRSADTLFCIYGREDNNSKQQTHGEKYNNYVPHYSNHFPCQKAFLAEAALHPRDKNLVDLLPCRQLGVKKGQPHI